MSLSIFDINDEFKFLKKMIEEKKIKSEVVVSAKKQIYEHLDLKYNDYVASIAKIAREVDKKMEETKQYTDNIQEVLLYFKKKLEFETKLTANQAAEFLNKSIPYPPLHMNKLQEEILELEKRQKPVLEDKVDIEALGIQMGRLQWLSGAIAEVKSFKNVIESSNKKDKLYFRLYKLIQVTSFVLSVYGAFYIIELLKSGIKINEFFLHLIAGVIVLIFVDSITNKIKENVFQNYLEKSISNFSNTINEMKKVDKALSDYTF